MSYWRLLPPFDQGESARAFVTLDEVFALDGEVIASDPLSEVLRLQVGESRYYIKRYRRASSNWLRRWFGRSRVQAEWQNLLAFHAWGIPSAPIVAYGQERGPGGFRRGALITQEIPASTDLAQLAHSGAACLRDPAWLRAVITQAAHATRVLHGRRFAHNDLKWRNLLVDDAVPPMLYLIDCPNGRTWRPPFLGYRITKDLACLDKVAKYHLSRTWRLRFYLAYSGRSRLSSRDKAAIHRILAFFEGRE